ncbi:hypothetical protein MNBD_UNCLBAC01-167 [hydrothermal vent metagenome]|uniref:Uncharacterized protein n=1 Tax=hydrothermal vent metagenome TaxID=652676 RepID=A0A3B1DLQ9_9ZZZZ
MKKHFFIFLFIFFLMDFSVFAQEHFIPTDRLLEFSLMSLKESARETALNNEELFSQSELLKEKIQHLHEELNSLDKKKQRLLSQMKQYDGFLAGESEQVLSVENGLKQLQGNVVRVQQQNKILEDHVKLKKQTMKNTQDKITQIVQDIKGFKYKKYDIVDIDDSDVIGKGFILKRSIEETKEELFKIEKQISYFERKHMGPLNTIEKLKQKHEGLKEQQNIFQEALTRAIKEGQKIEGETESVEEQSAQQEKQLVLDIKGLRGRYQQLTKNLVQAEKKLKARKLNLLDGEESAERELQGNISVIKEEKFSLKKKISSLRKTLRQLEEDLQF